MPQIDDETMRQLKGQTKIFGTLGAAMLILIIGSTLFFHVVEKWKVLDAYYYTIVTISTVGYGDYVPHTDLGKIGATVLIIVGFGIFAAFASTLLKRFALRRALRQEKRNH